MINLGYNTIYFLKILKGWGLKKILKGFIMPRLKTIGLLAPFPPPLLVSFFYYCIWLKIYFPSCIASENVSKHFYVVLPSLLENEILSLKSYPFRQNLNFLKIITLMSKRITESFIMIFGTYLFLKVRDFYKVLAKTSKYLKGIQHLKQTCTLKTQIDIRTCIQNHVTDMSTKSIYHLAKQYGWEE